MAAQTSLCQTWSDTPKTGFLASRLIWEIIPISCLRLLKGHTSLVQALISWLIMFFIKIIKYKNVLINAVEDQDLNARKHLQDACHFGLRNLKDLNTQAAKTHLFLCFPIRFCALLFVRWIKSLTCVLYIDNKMPLSFFQMGKITLA